MRGKIIFKNRPPTSRSKNNRANCASNPTELGARFRPPFLAAGAAGGLLPRERRGGPRERRRRGLEPAGPRLPFLTLLDGKPAGIC